MIQPDSFDRSTCYKRLNVAGLHFENMTPVERNLRGLDPSPDLALFIRDANRYFRVGDRQLIPQESRPGIAQRSNAVGLNQLASLAAEVDQFL